MKITYILALVTGLIVAGQTVEAKNGNGRGCSGKGRCEQQKEQQEACDSGSGREANRQGRKKGRNARKGQKKQQTQQKKGCTSCSKE